MLLNVFIFAFYYGDSLPVFFAAQILEGIPWGVFIANAPAYCSEIVPIQLRAPATQMLQMFWAIGSSKSSSPERLNHCHEFLWPLFDVLDLSLHLARVADLG